MIAPPMDPCRPSKVMPIIDFESILLRGAGNCCFGSTLDLYGVFQALGPLNMVTEHWIRGIRLLMVEPRRIRLPVDKHAQWKKR